jgi:NADH:ubiquinone oxidoreductase subunit 5 (subunit L)/multisubunit Na+/H+ antiporter MnhA subunit
LTFYLDRRELRVFKGLTERSTVARHSHRFLLNKYYLDHLYENVVVDGIRGPIARASYWVNQHVIDGVVNGAGKLTATVGQLTYRWVDQAAVDGAVNGIARETDNAGGLLRYVQSGRVQRYALFLFAAVGILAVALVIFS